MTLRIFFGLSLCCGSLFADELLDQDLSAKTDGQIAYIEPVVLTRTDSLPVENFEDATDPYLEGYIQALVDIHYYEYRVVVIVKDHHVFFGKLAKERVDCKEYHRICQGFTWGEVG